MLVKGLVLTALVASTPLALVVTQDPTGTQREPAPTLKAPGQDAEAKRAAVLLDQTQAELQAARQDLQRLRQQLDAALDRLDGQFEPQRDRNCSPSRNRQLMSHYQWLRDQGHGQRAATTLAQVVEQTGEDVNRLNAEAWQLMTEETNAGKFDDVALALVQRMTQNTENLGHHQLDTAALAFFLNGKVDQAIALERQAIERGGKSDEYRRKLRTYEAAHEALVKAGEAAKLPPATMVASNDDED